jgi:hypothetical protein
MHLTHDYLHGSFAGSYWQECLLLEWDPTIAKWWILFFDPWVEEYDVRAVERSSIRHFSKRTS